MTQPDHQADPSPRESPLYRQIIAAWDTKFTRPANDAVDVTMAMAAAECADTYYATTRTSPQLSEEMVGQERIEDVIAQALTYEISDTAYLHRLSRKAAKAVISALTAQGNE